MQKHTIEGNVYSFKRIITGEMLADIRKKHVNKNCAMLNQFERYESFFSSGETLHKK